MKYGFCFHGSLSSSSFLAAGDECAVSRARTWTRQREIQEYLHKMYVNGSELALEEGDVSEWEKGDWREMPRLVSNSYQG